ncbi:MAG: hypothetical protein U0904_06070, partial [Candidatus Nanopelagicales bacterium]|nr:hypothetical protein [Candidatus Nanopelagicales bacterium]
ERLCRYESDGLVEVTGHTDDGPGELQRAGFILSTSRRESFHQGLIEGALSGSVAVVRNWPMLARYGGPGTFLPKPWICEDAMSMSERICALIGDERKWEVERLACREAAAELAGTRRHQGKLASLLIPLPDSVPRSIVVGAPR